MANTKDIRAKIVSTKKTQQTTRAMKVVSAAKLKKAQHNITNARPYAFAVRSVIKKIAASKKVSHPLLNAPTEKQKTLVVVVTSDRGLCGAFNTNINKYTQNLVKEMEGNGTEFDLGFIGRKGADYFKKLGREGVFKILNLSRTINYELAAEVAEDLLEKYESGPYSEIRLVYNEFKSAIAHNVIDEKLLPLATNDDEEESEEDKITSDFVFEPAAEQIIDALLEKHFAVQVYRVFQESVAAEHGARMSAMENATKNAGEMIDGLTLTYNKIRQSAITTELIEITSGAEALNG